MHENQKNSRSVFIHWMTPLFTSVFPVVLLPMDLWFIFMTKFLNIIWIELIIKYASLYFFLLTFWTNHLTVPALDSSSEYASIEILGLFNLLQICIIYPRLFGVFSLKPGEETQKSQSMPLFHSYLNLYSFLKLFFHGLRGQ